ncbi:hypothetical protein BME99_02640 [Pseudomonas protegens]|nr:hypothetical protein BME99_02640 [Pseudomonas protegens]
MVAGVLGVGVDLDAVLLLDRQAQLQGIHRVQAEAFAEQRLVVADVLGTDVFEAQGVDDQQFDFKHQVRVCIAHLWRAP